jgi:transcriptional regulator with XRE-family HTH domain
MMTTGMELKLERVQLGVQQYRLAAALGITATELGNLEAGRKALTPERITAIQAALARLAASTPEAPEELLYKRKDQR